MTRNKKIAFVFAFITTAILSLVAGVLIFAILFLETDVIKPISVITEGLGGVSVRIISYQSVDSDAEWLIDKNKITMLTISDWKNDGPKFRFIIPGVSLRLGFFGNSNRYLIHGGEKFAAIRIPTGKYNTGDRLYIVHRIPKSMGEVIIEYVDVPGTVVGVASDESGYFYYPGYNSVELIKVDWGGKELMKTELPEELENSLGKLIFFQNGDKLAVDLYNREENDYLLFVWDLVNDKTDLISITELFPSYLGGSFIVEDDGKGDLYITKKDCNVGKIRVYK